MTCLKKIQNTEVFGSTFNSRNLITSADISNYSFKAVVKSSLSKSILAEIDGIKYVKNVVFDFSVLETLNKSKYIIEYWGDFGALGNEPFLLEELGIVSAENATNCANSDNLNFEIKLDEITIPITISKAINQFFLDFESLTDEQKAQLKGDAFTYEDFTSEQIAELQKPATDKVEELDALELSLNNAESLRVQNENTRISSEETRNTNEIDRSYSENSRQENEVSRQENENARILAETERNDTETVRISNENTRETSENTRTTNEQTRINAETERINAETSRSSAENTRVTAETERLANENERKTAENARVSAENTRTTAETSRSNAENNRSNAENTRISNENSRVTAENTRVTNESSRVSAENARVTAENARKAAGYITSPNALILQPISQADYNALAVKVPTTIYMIY